MRQHHTNAGINDCQACHPDANPDAYTPVSEDVPPPYCFTPDDIFANKPTDPCNAVGEKNYGGFWEVR